MHLPNIYTDFSSTPYMLISEHLFKNIFMDKKT